MVPRDKDFEGSKKPDRLKAFSGLLSDVSTLITELELSRESRQADNTFVFELLNNNQVVLPPHVTALLPKVDQVVVTIGKEEEGSITPPPYLSVHFLSQDALIAVSRSSDGKDPDEPDVYIDLSVVPQDTPVPYRPLTQSEVLGREINEAFSQRQIEVEKMSQKEINTLLMSLIYPNADRNYTRFEGVDLLRSDTFEDLLESFKYAALGHQNSMSHTFATGGARFDFNKQEGQPISFSVYYNEVLEGETETGRPIVAKSNFETDFRLVFETYEERSAPLTGRTEKGIVVSLGEIAIDSPVPYFPSTKEIQALRKILIREINQINPATVPLYKNVLIDEVDAEQSFERSGQGDLIFSPTHIQNMLDKFGFDSPDSGAA
jgi:hypothetical protein